MSSTYRVLCLSHDPAIETGVEWSTGTDNEAAAARVPETIEGHEHCDLVLVQCAYPVIAVGCLPQESREGRRCAHQHAQWTEAWALRLLWLLLDHPGSREQWAIQSAPYCWRQSGERLYRLRTWLGFEAGPDA